MSGFIKQGEAQIVSNNINMDSVNPDPAILAEFTKIANELKKIAPKAQDFLYFSAVMMHAAEAAAVNEDGTPKLTSRGETLKVGWNESNGTWKWETNDPAVKPYKNCFVPGTEIVMADGSVKNIENIEVGDFVLTHKGRAQKVLKRFITPHEGKVVKLKIKNNQAIVCTDNHPFYHADLTGFASNGLKSLTNMKKGNESFRTEFKFSKASDLVTGDLLLSPVVHTKIESNLNPNRARLLGIYAAEGSFSKKYEKRQAVRFTIGIHEQKQAELIASVFQEEFPDCNVIINPEPSRSVIEITASGNNIAEYFYYHCGEYSHEKKLSKELVFGSDEVKKSFLCGYIDGDGCLTDYNKIILITVSPHLANQTRIMLNSMKIGNSLRKVNTSTKKFKLNGTEYNCKDNYRIELYGDSYKKLDLDTASVKYKFGNFNHKIISNFEKYYCLHYLTSKEELDYKGDVFNIEVEEDHSYIANGVVVSNCNGDIFPEKELVKAYKKWVGKPLCIDHKSSSVDFVRGIIVDTYYDRDKKRVIALCALDKINYPELARNVSSGVSASVSMGTAVGKAICSDCGTVARVEADFCKCMKNKTCYGEINCDLQPIELSIVVNGADPQAKIKTIIAAAGSLNRYLDNKEKEINKLATSDVTFQEISAIKDALEQATEKLQLLEDKMSGESSVDSTENTKEPSEEPAEPEVQRATDDELMSEFNSLKEATTNKLQAMQEILTKMASKFNTKEDEMSGKKEINKEGYFQGGGGVNEPAPKQVKYEIDPLNDKARMEDKHLSGQHNMDLGPVDGMAPGPESAGMSEMERKKKLLRAQTEERSMRRAAALKQAKENLMQTKEGYFQGGGGENEPTPGKEKYKADPMNEKIRDKEDKQMQGQPPFPGVGAVDGLHPSPASADQKDELKRKELLQRASLKAKFIKAAKSDGSDDLGNSAWQVFQNDRLVLSASVSELSNGKVDALYDSIATKEFGSKMLAKVRELGVKQASVVYKTAQAAPAPAAPAAPEAMPAMPDMSGAMGDAPAAEDGKGDPKENAVELAAQVRDLSSDLKDAVDVLAGQPPEVGGDAPAAGSMTTASLKRAQVEIHGALKQALSKASSDLLLHEKELKTIASIYEGKKVNSKNSSYIESIVTDAFADAKKAIADSYELMGGFVKYVRGSEALMKRSALEAKMSKVADMHSEDSFDMDHDMGHDMDHSEEGHDHDSDEDLDLDALLDGAELGDHHMVDDTMSDDAMVDDTMSDDAMVDDAMSDDENDVMVDMKPADLSKMDPNTKLTTASFDLNTKEGRTAYRAKLAADTMKVSPMLGEAHPHGGETTKLEVKPSGDLAKVEDLEEVHDAMMDVAKAPVKVRKEAEKLQALITEGKVAAADVDSLVSYGLDADVVKYWKQYYGQVDGGAEFASELLKEHAKAQRDEDSKNYKVKIARAYELAYEMAHNDLIPSDKNAITAQVEDIMSWNSESFDSIKRVIASAKGKRTKTASIPSVGLTDFSDAPVAVDDLATNLSKAFSGRKY